MGMSLHIEQAIISLNMTSWNSFNLPQGIIIKAFGNCICLFLKCQEN